MKRRLQGLLSLWLAVALLCSVLVVPVTAAPNKATVLYTGFEQLSEVWPDNYIDSSDYEDVQFQADTSLREMPEFTGWKKQALKGWQLWTGSWDSGNIVTDLTPFGGDYSTNPDTTISQVDYDGINSDYLVLEPVLKPYEEAYFHTGSKALGSSTSKSEIYDCKDNPTAVILDMPLNEQDELKGYVITPPVGTKHTGWNLWGSDIRSGRLGSLRLSLSLDGMVTQENAEDFRFSDIIIEALFTSKYWFTQQPTAENNYTVVVNELGELGSYAWYPTRIYDVVGNGSGNENQNQIEVAPPGEEVAGSYSNGSWTSDGNVLAQVLPLEAGDVLTISTDGAFEETIAGNIDAEQQYELTPTSTGFTFTAEQDIQNFIFILGSSESFSAEITVTRTAPDAVEGQTAATFSGPDDGAYVCRAVFNDGVTITSEPVDYIYTPPHTHCVCGGSVTTGNHTHDAATTWTAWESAASLPDQPGSYYLTQNVDLAAAWTVPAGEVNLCLNGKTVSGSTVKQVGSSIYTCVDIPGGSTLTVCDHAGGGGMNMKSYKSAGASAIYGGEGSALALYGGSVSLTKNGWNAIIYTLLNGGGTFDVYGGAVSASHSSSGNYREPYACGVYIQAGTTNLWGGRFEGNVSNSTPYGDDKSGGYGVIMQGTGVLCLAGAPGFAAANSTNANNQAAIQVVDNQSQLYAQAGNIPFSGGNVTLRVGSHSYVIGGYGDGGIVVREVTDGNKDKFSVTNPPSGYTLTEVTEDNKHHLALTGPYTVEFNANGGEGNMENQSFTGYPHSQPLTRNTYVREGYRFTGWNTAQDGSGKSCADGAAVSGLAYGGTVTLYAQWEDVIPTPTAETEYKYIFANGAPLLLEAGRDNENYTVVYIDRNGNGQADDGIDTIFDPDGPNSGAMNGTEEGNDLSEWEIYGACDGIALTGDAKLTMTGGKVKNLFGGGRDSGSSVGNGVTISITGGTVEKNVYGMGYNSTVGGQISATIGDRAKVGGDDDGVHINGGDVVNGVDSFAIAPSLTGNADSIRVILPAGFDVSTKPTIATGAVQGDLAKIKLAGDGAAGKVAYLEDSDVKVRNISGDATLSNLTYKVGNGQPTAVPNFTAGTLSYNVNLPYNTAQTASITLTGTTNDSQATIIENNGATLSGGSGAAIIKVKAEDGTTTKTYTVNFTTAADTRSGAKQITAFTVSNQVGNTAIDQSSHTIAVTMPNGTNVSSLTPTIEVSTNASVSPTSGTAQDFTNPVTYTVTAENETTQDYTVRVEVQAPSATAPTITTASLPSGTVGTQYSETLTADGTAPITWSVSAGSLPDGLTLSGDGLISGTPTTGRTFVLTVKATNGAGSATKQLSIQIAAAAVTRVTVTPPSAWVQRGDIQQFNATVSGTNIPAQTVTWSIQSGHASGTSISESGLLTVGSDESQGMLSIKATSTVDTSKSGTATVYVTDPPVTRYTLTVSGGSGSGGYAQGAEITVTANTQANKRFKAWTASGITLADAAANPVTITMPAGAVTLTATYDDLYAVTASSDGNGTAAAIPAIAAAGETIRLSAASDSGYQFKEWQVVSGGAVLANAEASGTSFTMPNTAVEVRAVFEAVPTYTVTIQNGGSGASGNGSYAKGAAVAISAGTLGGYSFSGWTVVSGGVSLASQNQSTTFVMPAENVTVRANWSGKSSDDDDESGNGSGSGGTPPSTVPPSEPKPDTPVTAQTEIKAQSGGTGGAEVTVSKNVVDSVLQKALEEAKRNGTQDNGVAVQINVTADNQGISSLTVNLPKVTQEQLIENKVRNFTMALQRPDIALSLSLESVHEINRQANADVQLTAARLTDTSALSGEAKAVVGSRPVFQLTATYHNGASSITDFGGGSVTVTIPYKLQPGESAGGLCLTYIDEQGKTHLLTNSSYDRSEEALRGATSHFSLYAVGYKAPDSFSDTKDHWAREDIEFAAARGLIPGAGNGRFNPDGAMTRAMFVTALGRLAGIDPAKYSTSSFTDVPENAYYAPYVAWAEKIGIVQGGGLFEPEQSLSRQEMALITALCARGMGCKIPAKREAVIFSDSASIASWASGAVKAMQQAGVLMGKDGNRFDPLGDATRAQAAAVLRRFTENVIYSSNAQGWDVNDSGHWMYYQNGKPVTGQRAIDGAAHSFDMNSLVEKIVAVAPDTKKYITHRIVYGDTLWDLARLHHCAVAEIVSINGIKNSNFLPVGMEIRIPQK